VLFCTSSFRLAIFYINCQDVRPKFYRPRELINISSLMGGGGGGGPPPPGPKGGGAPLKGAFPGFGEEEKKGGVSHI